MTSSRHTTSSSTAPFVLTGGRSLPEAAFQGRITQLCDLLRLRWWHDNDSRRNREGFPDLVIVGAHGRGVLFAELKAEKGRPTAEQDAWLRAIAVSAPRPAGVDVRLWRPSDWDSDIVPTLKRLARPVTRASAPSAPEGDL